MMRRILLLASWLLISTSTGTVWAQTVDASVKAALYEIERVENQLAGASSSQAAKLKRIERMLENAGLQLEKSENKQHDSWADANRRYNAATEQLNSLKKPAPTAPAQPPTANLSAADSSHLVQLEQQTNNFIALLNTYKTEDYDKNSNQLLATVEVLKAQWRRLSNQTHEHSIGFAQHIINIETHINTQLEAAAIIAKRQKQAEERKQAEVKQQAEVSKKTANSVNTATTKASPTPTSVATDPLTQEVKARLKEIRQRMHPNNRSWFGSPVPDAPFTQSDILTFAAGMNEWREATKNDLKFVYEIDSDHSSVRNTTNALERDLSSIKRYNQEMNNRIDKYLTEADNLVKNFGSLSERGFPGFITKLEYGLAMLSVATQFNQTIGKKTQPDKAREQSYVETIAVMKSSVKSANEKQSKVTVATTKPAAPVVVQEIQVYDARTVEVTSDGEIWINGGKEGDITADGEIWVAGNKEGDLTQDGEVWKAGINVGEITESGEVWREGNQIGTVEADGTIWFNGVRQGWFKGGEPAQAAAILFFGFFAL